MNDPTTIYSVDRKIDLLIVEVRFVRTELAEQKKTALGFSTALQAQALEIALLKQAQTGHKLNFSRGWDLIHWLITAGLGGLFFLKH